MVFQSRPEGSEEANQWLSERVFPDRETVYENAWGRSWPGAPRKEGKELRWLERSGVGAGGCQGRKRRGDAVKDPGGTGALQASCTQRGMCAPRANAGWDPAFAPLPQPRPLVWVGLYAGQAVPESDSYQGPLGASGIPQNLNFHFSEKGSHWRPLNRRVHDLAYIVPGWPKAICFILKNKDISSYGSRVKKYRGVVVIGQCALTGTGMVGYFWALSWLKFPKSLINTTWGLSPSTKLDFCHHLKNDWISTYTSKPLL